MQLPQHITAGGHTLTLTLRRNPRARRLSIRLNPLHDEVALTLPHRCPHTLALKFLEEKRPWLEHHATRLPVRIPLSFGETIPVFGEPRCITRAQDQDAGSEDAHTAFPVLATPKGCERTVKRMLKTQMQGYVALRAEQMAEAIGQRIAAIRLADPVARWGSCSADGKLMLSWRLVFAPKDVLDYVIAHEVAHVKEHNHSPAFWQIVRLLCPEFRAHRTWLRQHGHMLFRYGGE